MKSDSIIASCEYLRKWADGSVDVRFICFGNGVEFVKTYKTMQAAKAQVTKYLNRCSRIYS